MSRRFDRTPEKTAFARAQRRQLTPAEAKLWSALRSDGVEGASFRKQHPIGPYTLDFYCPALNLAIEVDGDTHATNSGAARDHQRTAYLASKGVETARFPNRDVLNALDGVVATIADIIRAKRHELGITPPLEKGGPGGDLPNTPATAMIPPGASRIPPFSRGGKGRSVPPLEKGGSGGDRNFSQPEMIPSGPFGSSSPWQGGEDRAYGPNELAAEFALSPATMDRLAAFDRVLIDWSSRMNLVARSTIADRWARHYRDSAQLFALLPRGARRLLDLGSGAGFPGLVLAAMGADQGLKVTLVDSIQKKAAFLRAAAAAMGLEVEVRAERIESLQGKKPDAITARALAPLPKLLGYAAAFADETTHLILPKGQDVGAELTEATQSWQMRVTQTPSLTQEGAAILTITGLKAKKGRAKTK